MVYRPVVALAVAAASAETAVSLAASLEAAGAEAASLEAASLEAVLAEVEAVVAAELLLWPQAQRLNTRVRVSSAMASFFIMIQKSPF